MTLDTIFDLIQQGENSSVEFKSSLRPESHVKEMVAFSNSFGGGKQIQFEEIGDELDSEESYMKVNAVNPCGNGTTGKQIVDVYKKQFHTYIISYETHSGVAYD